MIDDDEEEDEQKKAKFLEKRKTYEYHEYPAKTCSDELDDDAEKTRSNHNSEIDCGSEVSDN